MWRPTKAFMPRPELALAEQLRQRAEQFAVQKRAQAVADAEATEAMKRMTPEERTEFERERDYRRKARRLR